MPGQQRAVGHRLVSYRDQCLDPGTEGRTDLVGDKEQGDRGVDLPVHVIPFTPTGSRVPKC